MPQSGLMGLPTNPSLCIGCVSLYRHGSANMLWLALTTRVPITNIANSVLTFVPGHKPMG